jgi:EpsI family protein
MSANDVIRGHDLTGGDIGERRGDMLSRRKLIIGLAVGGTVALSELYVPRRSVARISEENFGKLIPEQLGPWRYATQSGLVLPPEDQLSRTLYEQLLTRVYTDGGADPVMLVMAYSSVQEGRLQVHRPEVCYPAAGFSIIENSPATVPINDHFSIPMRFLVADRGARREYVMYWTRIGDSMPIRWFDQRLMMARANLQGFIPDGLLARVSVISDDRDEATATLTRFVQTLVADSGRAGRAMLIGPH